MFHMKLFISCQNKVLRETLLFVEYMLYYIHIIVNSFVQGKELFFIMTKYTNPTMEAILTRRSIRAYSDEALTAEELKDILDSAEWAPTARNEQETMFISLEGPALDELLAGFGNPGAVYGAKNLILIYARQSFPYFEIDSGIAVQSMALAAKSIGLGSVIVGCIREYLRGSEADKWKKKFGVPEDYIFTIGIVIGHPLNDTPPKDRNPGRVVSF